MKNNIFDEDEKIGLLFWGLALLFIIFWGAYVLINF